MIHTFHTLGITLFGVLLGFIIGQLCEVWEDLEDLAKEAEWQEVEDQLEETERLRANAFAAYDQQVAKNTEMRHELEDWRKNVDDLMEGRVSFEVMREIYLNGKRGE